jgi:hypothetical protein
MFKCVNVTDIDQMFQMISQNFTIAIFMAKNYIKIQTLSVILMFCRLLFLQHHLKSKIQVGVINMSTLSLLDVIKTKSNTQLVFVLIMSLFLSACGSGAGGGEDSIENSANVDTQTPTETEEQASEEVAAVQITTQPQNVTKNAGENTSFTVSASGGGSLSFQWRKNQQAIQGATSNSLTLSNLSESDGASYDVLVSNSVGSITSFSALLTVNTQIGIIDEPVIDPVVIVSQPQGITVNENDSASFSVQITAGGEVTYQWLKNGGIIDGANSISFSLNTVSANDEAVYSVIVTNSAGPVVSNSASLSITAVQVASSIELTWDIPQAREDGSDLALGEINGYIIAYGTNENNMSTQLTVEGASTTNTILGDLSTGIYFFTIATIDSDGVQGAYSSVIQQSI